MRSAVCARSADAGLTAVRHNERARVPTVRAARGPPPMNGRQSRTLQALRRVSGFVAAETTKSDGPPLLARMAADLDRSIERIHELSVTQLTARSTLRNEPRNVEQLRRTIRRDRMMPLIKVARPLLKFAPG